MGETLVSLLPILAIFLIFWLLMIRPASRRQKALAELQRGLDVGDRVLTQSGMFGTIDHFDGDKIGLEIAPGVVVSVVRPAVVGLAAEDVEDTDQTDSADLTVETSVEQDR